MAKSKRNRASIQDALALAVGDASETLPVEEVLPAEEVLPVGAPPEVLPVVGKKTTQSQGHTKTSTGYVKASGEKIVRLTLHFTPTQKRHLKAQALEAGFDSPSEYVVKKLGL